MEQQRLDKIIASTGKWSRREAKELARRGQVTVNGAAIRSAEEKFDPETAEIFVNGEVLCYRRNTWIMLNKPAGYLSATEDGRGKTVLDLLPRELQKQALFPVGRLDKDTEGLLLLTNKGEAADQIMRGRNFHEKEYLVTVDREVTEEFLASMSRGVPILGTVTRECQVERTGRKSFRIVLTQGLNRQIRRMCEYLGYQVATLKRIRVMNIQLDGLKPGEYREITGKEREQLDCLLGTGGDYGCR